jgi:hypothetical protein
MKSSDPISPNFGSSQAGPQSGPKYKVTLKARLLLHFIWVATDESLLGERFQWLIQRFPGSLLPPNFQLPMYIYIICFSLLTDKNLRRLGAQTWTFSLRVPWQIDNASRIKIDSLPLLGSFQHDSRLGTSSYLTPSLTTLSNLLMSATHKGSKFISERAYLESFNLLLQNQFPLMTYCRGLAL